jgi:hypothetical protein
MMPGIVLVRGTKAEQGKLESNVNARCRDLGRHDEGVQDSSSYVVGIAEGRAEAVGVLGRGHHV